MEDAYVVLATLGGILAIYFVLKYLSDKNGFKVNAEVIYRIKTAIMISDLFLEVINIPKPQRDTSKKILDIADITANYVDEMCNSSTLPEKIHIARYTVNEILKNLRISPTESEQNLINIVIEESLKFIEANKSE